jgi:hypothetical protein
MKNQLMIDIETLSTQPNGVIVSIGAAFFDITDGRIGQTFNQQICADFSEQSGFVTDQSTLDWWAKQTPAARALSLHGEAKPQEVLIHLEDWIRHQAECELKDLQVWANSPSFDLVMLKHHFDRYAMRLPWRYYNERDVRTLKAIGDAFGIPPVTDPNPGTKHTALDDALSQIKTVCRVYWALNHDIDAAKTQRNQHGHHPI